MQLLEGFGLGIATVIFIGPVFFLVLQTSLQFGIRSGIAVVFGIISSDIVCACLCYFGLASIFIYGQAKFLVGISGTLILLLTGFFYLFKKTEPKILNQTICGLTSYWHFFAKGFGINFFNPFVFAVWIGIFEYGNSIVATQGALIWFLIAVLFGILLTDLCKVFFAHYIRKWLSDHWIKNLYKGVGILLIIFAIRLFYSTVFET